MSQAKYHLERMITYFSIQNCFKCDYDHCRVLSVISGGSRGGKFGATAYPKPLWRPLEWRPFAINAPLFGAHGSSITENVLVVRLNNAVFSYIRSSYVSSIMNVTRTVFTKDKFA